MASTFFFDAERCREWDANKAKPSGYRTYNLHLIYCLSASKKSEKMLRKIKPCLSLARWRFYFLSHRPFFIINSLPSLFHFTSIFFAFYRRKSFSVLTAIAQHFCVWFFFLLPERCSLATPLRFSFIPSENSLILLSFSLSLNFSSHNFIWVRIKEQFWTFLLIFFIEIFIKDFSLRIDLQKSTKKALIML